MRELYWLWRDRKGVIGNPLSLVANVVFLYGLSTAMWSRVTPSMARLAAATLALQVLRSAIRMACSGRIYGFTFALGVPVRAVYANLLNSAASFHAVAQYAWARIRGERLK
jgi:adsorption protein B